MITQREWQRFLHLDDEYPNPVKVGFKFVQYLKDHPNSTYDELAGMSGVSKARICQMAALCKRLPSLISDYLLNTDDPEVMKHFTERRLRPLTMLVSDDVKIRVSYKMMRKLKNSKE